MNLTPLGIVHTILSFVSVVSAVVALIREGEVSPKHGTGRVYIWSLVFTCLTGFPIFRHGTIGPPHILGGIILAMFAVAAVAGKTRIFGRGSAYVETISYSATVFFLSISMVTETLTRVPPGAPVVAGPEAPIFKTLYLGLLILFLSGVTLQVRKLRVGVRVERSPLPPVLPQLRPPS